VCYSSSEAQSKESSWGWKEGNEERSREGSLRKEVNSCEVNPNQGSKREGHRTFLWEITGLEA